MEWLWLHADSRRYIGRMGRFTIRVRVTDEEYELARSVTRAGYAGTMDAAFRQHIEREAGRASRSRAPFLLVGSGDLFLPLASHIHSLSQWERDQLWVVDLEYRSPVADTHFGGMHTSIFAPGSRSQLSDAAFRLREEIADADAVIFVGDMGSPSYRAAEEQVVDLARRVGRPVVSLLYTTWVTELPSWSQNDGAADHVRIFLEEPGAGGPRERSQATRAACTIIRALLLERPRRDALPYWLRGESRPWLANVGETRSGSARAAFERALQRSPPGKQRVILLPHPISHDIGLHISHDDESPPFPAVYYGERRTPREVFAVLLTQLE